MMIAHAYAERLLTINNLSLSLGGKQILRDINLHIDNVTRPGKTQGQVVALLGPSGIGKTQLFRCIAGLQCPSVGSVVLNSDKHAVTAGEVGVVQQSYPLMPHRTVLSNLLMVTPDKDRIHALLSRFHLSDKQHHFPSQLSGGQRQRVAIIQQMLCSKYFILMDEPFSGLDVVAKDNVCALIDEVSSADEHSTIIFTTHDLESAVTVADTIWVLGREEGKPGATIRTSINLIERDLAWNPEVDKHPNFWSTIQELKHLFKTL
jgi:ABC-type nitrate/sulfonate/bicarbonate transport system ATPase subunit